MGVILPEFTGCPISMCNSKKSSMWICNSCGSDCCYNHEHFAGMLVSYCSVCRPDKFPDRLTLVVP